MKIAVLGTGVVGRTVGARLAGLCHDVVIGTRDVDATMARTTPDRMGNPPFVQWQAEHPDVRLVSYTDAGKHGELVVNATAGQGSLVALESAGTNSLAGKVILDTANPLDFSAGFTPSLSVVSTDSLAEQIQRAFPAARVVKALNTMTCAVMVDPRRLAENHNVFVAGDDPDAKSTVEELLREMGWDQRDIIDLGGLRAARSAEMYLPLWLSIMSAVGTADFNIKIVKARQPERTS